MVQLTEYKDLEEYLKYLNGEILVWLIQLIIF
jgi:hypothetical protein